MTEEAPRRLGWFEKITTRDIALLAIRDASRAFFVVAALQFFAAFVLGLTLLFDAAVLAVGGVVLLKYNSRVAAVILLLLTTAQTIMTVANLMGLGNAGGGNVVLAVIVLWAAVRATEAAFKLNGRFARQAPTNPSAQG